MIIYCDAQVLRKSLVELRERQDHLRKCWDSITRILMWLCLRASFVVHSSFDVSVGVQRYENGAPLQQGFELLGMRALARTSSGFVLR
jgi:hypothetical protein